MLTSGSVQVFGCRHDEAIHALRRPASEKRQGTKSQAMRRAHADLVLNCLTSHHPNRRHPNRRDCSRMQDGDHIHRAAGRAPVR
jgi:hypothetical protein